VAHGERVYCSKSVPVVFQLPELALGKRSRWVGVTHQSATAVFLTGPVRTTLGDEQRREDDYNVVMAHPVSVRFQDSRVAERLRSEATTRRASTSALAEELIDEGLRTRRHPLVQFRDGPAGRRASIGGGPDIWEVIEGLLGGDVPPDQRISRAVEVFGLRREQIEAALAYYAEFTEEIDVQIEANRQAAEEAEALWRRQQVLLAG
jgi:hypothetical protein